MEFPESGNPVSAIGNYEKVTRERNRGTGAQGGKGERRKTRGHVARNGLGEIKRTNINEDR